MLMYMTTNPSTPFLSHWQLSEAVHQLPPKIQYPLHLDASTVKGKFTFRPPVAVKVIGSYLLKTAIKPDLNVDLALHIPEVSLHSAAHTNTYTCIGWGNVLYMCMFIVSLKH